MNDQTSEPLKKTIKNAFDRYREENFPGKPCGCPEPENGFPVCCICDIQMCPQNSSSFCSQCADSLSQNVTTRDDFGRIIDPVTKKVLLTSICGKVMKSMSPCLIASFGGDKTHKPIVVKDGQK